MTLPGTLEATGRSSSATADYLLPIMTSMEERYEHARMRQKNHEQYDGMETFQMFKDLAEEGHAASQCTTAMALRAMGKHAECLEMLTRAASQDNPRALTQMGVFHYNGDCGLEASHEKSIEYYRKAAELGERRAMLHVAMMMEEGEGCEKNAEVAADMYRELTLDDDPIAAEAAYHLGVLCLSGELGRSIKIRAEGMTMLKEAEYGREPGARKALDYYGL